MGRLQVVFEKRNNSGELIAEEISQCTATLVGGCHLLTISHCMKPVVQAIAY